MDRTVAYSVRLRRMHHHGPGIETASRLAIDFRFQIVPQPFVLCQCRPRHTRWGHHACAQLAYNLFPFLGVISHRSQIQLLKRKIGSFQLVVMAGHAVLIREGRVLPLPTGQLFPPYVALARAHFAQT